MADEKDPIGDMLAIDDEAARAKAPEAVDLNIDPPPDKVERERDEAGKFKGKEGDEKKPDEKPELKAEPKVEEKPKETVPLATFLEKTNKLKADLEARDITLNEFKTKLAALEAKLPKEQPVEPDFIEDPKAYVDHKLKAALDGIAEANKKAETAGTEAKAAVTQATEQAELQAFFGQLASREQRFIAENPDYHDALGHIRNIRAAQMREFQPDVTEEQIIAAIKQEETQLAVNLARQGRDPVQVAYNLAKHFGYQPKARVVEPPKVESKLPEVPAAKKLPPDQTLGSGAGAASEETQDEPDAVDLAFASIFPKRKSA